MSLFLHCDLLFDVTEDQRSCFEILCNPHLPGLYLSINMGHLEESLNQGLTNPASKVIIFLRPQNSCHKILFFKRQVEPPYFLLQMTDSGYNI